MRRTARPSAWARASRAASTAPVWRARRRTTGGCASIRRCWTCPLWTISAVPTGTTPSTCTSPTNADGRAGRRRAGSSSSPTRPEPLTREEKRAWLDQLTGVSLGSDAFFPFGDNIERAHRSGVQYVAEPGGSIRDDNVIAVCDSYGMVMCLHRYAPVPSLIVS